MNHIQVNIMQYFNVKYLFIRKNYITIDDITIIIVKKNMEYYLDYIIIKI